MIVNIIGLGQTGKLWNGQGSSLGINDCWRHGIKTNALIACNFPNKFPQERLEIIKRSKPVQFYSNLEAWRQWHPNTIPLQLRSWDGHLYEKTTICTNTSASIALDLARKLGASKIILWGIDMVDHPVYNAGNGAGQTELKQLEQICKAFKSVGIEVYLGTKGSELEKFLTVHENTKTS